MTTQQDTTYNRRSYGTSVRKSKQDSKRDLESKQPLEKQPLESNTAHIKMNALIARTMASCLFV